MTDGHSPALPARQRILTLVALATLLGVVAVPLRAAIFGGEVLFRRDINMVWLPQVETLMRVLAASSWPLWDPYAGFGRPLLADPRAEVLYPPTWLNLVLPPGTYYTLFCLAHLFLAASGLYLLAREWGCSRLAAWVGGALLAVGGPLLSLVSMWHHLAGTAWIPWLFLCAERLQRRRRRVDFVLFGLAFALQVFAGSPDVTALVTPALALQALWPSGPQRPRWLARAGLLAGALALGLLLAALQWLPTLDWSLASQRRETSRAARVVWSLPPIALADLVLPLPSERWPLAPELRRFLFEDREPWLHSTYLGLPALGLALLGLRVRPTGPLLGLLALGAIGFSLGRFGPVYDPLCVLLPPLAWLRFPVKGMLLAGFALAALAALGLDAWTRASRRERVASALLVVVPVALFLLALRHPALPAVVGLAEGLPPTWLAPLLAAISQALGLGLVLTLVGLLGGSRPAPAWARSVLALVTVGTPLAAHHDLQVTASPLIYQERPRLLELFPRREDVRLYVFDYSISAVRPAPGEEPARAYELDRVPLGWPLAASLTRAVHQYLNPPTAARWGLRGSYDRDILGFEARPQARLVERLHAAAGRPGHLRLLQMASVTHALGLTPAPWWRDLRPLATLPGVFVRPIRVFEVPEPLPRAYAVSGARVRDEDGALELVSTGDFDPRGEIVLLAGSERPGRGTAGSVRLAAVSPDRLRLEANLDRDGFVVLTEAWDAGWKARVDGRAASVLRANLAFRAVEVPAGRHLVEMAYRPAAVNAGLALSLISAMACGLALRRRSRGGA